MATHTQVVVSKHTGQVEALYVWSDDFPWQGGFTMSDDGVTAWVERTDESDENFLHPVGQPQAGFDTLHAAVEAYLASPWAVPGVGRTERGDVVLG